MRYAVSPDDKIARRGRLQIFENLLAVCLALDYNDCLGER